jgi:hypothetical protein
VVSLYRQFLDGQKITTEQAMQWLARVPNRGYSSGFIKGGVGPDDYQWHRSNSEGNSLFVGNVEEMPTQTPQNGCVVRIRNTVVAGQTLETLSPDGTVSTLTLPDTLETTEGLWLDTAHNGQHLRLPDPLKPYTLLRAVLD